MILNCLTKFTYIFLVVLDCSSTLLYSLLHTPTFLQQKFKFYFLGNNVFLNRQFMYSEKTSNAVLL